MDNYEKGYLTPEAAENMLRNNNITFGVKAFYYCANVCNIWNNTASTNIDTKEQKCLGNFSAKFSISALAQRMPNALPTGSNKA
jgi:hypothetical protein